MGNPETKVTMNRHALTLLVLYGSQDAVENFFRESSRTRKRLGRRLRRVHALTRIPRGQGTYPNYHDVVRWLDDMVNDELHEDEIQFMLRAHLTARNRIPSDVIETLRGA